MNNWQKIKKILKESVSNKKITKLSVFDFDGTLADSPEPETGKVKYKEKIGKDWPHRGWWSKAESLDTDIFDIPVKSSVVADYEKEKSDPNTMVIMMTGRIPKLSKYVEKILSDNNLSFDEYYYNNTDSTLAFKINTMEKLLSKYPSIKSVKMWDDRVEHIGPFKAWGSTLDGIDFHITEVK